MTLFYVRIRPANQLDRIFKPWLKQKAPTMNESFCFLVYIKSHLLGSKLKVLLLLSLYFIISYQNVSVNKESHNFLVNCMSSLKAGGTLSIYPYSISVGASVSSRSYFTLSRYITDKIVMSPYQMFNIPNLIRVFIEIIVKLKTRHLKVSGSPSFHFLGRFVSTWKTDLLYDNTFLKC